MTARAHSLDPIRWSVDVRVDPMRASHQVGLQIRDRSLERLRGGGVATIEYSTTLRMFPNPQVVLRRLADHVIPLIDAALKRAVRQRTSACFAPHVGELSPEPLMPPNVREELPPVLAEVDGAAAGPTIGADPHGAVTGVFDIPPDDAVGGPACVHVLVIHRHAHESEGQIKVPRCDVDQTPSVDCHEIGEGVPIQVFRQLLHDEVPREASEVQNVLQITVVVDARRPRVHLIHYILDEAPLLEGQVLCFGVGNHEVG
mmetsp:Transcript_67536/g.195249  ORF Transcript_67536/g.195249 Transcript_67536/m.195249 type:complete len:258 (+) Transcript_67536:48-821(+)|eukprot:CAMPEP_0176015706 /NCGR_PEP_ID=MMETSP0120_2-20121206/7476_1 /TAXON_ID=160619 /ORGANISM="Kryptoperidinium foliaceum, Strain CCMP 1326" /LENGTH=257 /DNA_ID=CAMNT_0017348685 /DNA_START=24 /DNA_END=797 /DNA_ORIENTATION=+